MFATFRRSTGADAGNENLINIQFHILGKIEKEAWTRRFTLNSFAPGSSIDAMQVSIPWL